MLLLSFQSVFVAGACFVFAGVPDRSVVVCVDALSVLSEVLSVVVR